LQKNRLKILATRRRNTGVLSFHSMNFVATTRIFCMHGKMFCVEGNLDV